MVSLTYKIQENSLISVSQKEKTQQDLTNLKEHWEELETAIEDKAKR